MEELKARCLAVAQEALKPPSTFDPTSRILTRKLEDLLQSVEAFPPSEITPRVAEFVYFPLQSLLRHESLGSRQTELLLGCFTILCRTAWRRGNDLQLIRAQQLLAVTTYLLCPDSNVEMDAEKPSASFLAKPRTFHTAAFNLLNAIFQSANDSEIEEPISRSPIIVQIISLLLDAIKFDDDDLEAQKASVRCLETVVLCTISAPEHRALVLPKVVSRLSRLISPANRRHYQGKVAAVSCLAKIIVATIGDSTLYHGDKVRNKDWLRTTAQNLTQTFTILENLQRSLLENTGSQVSLLTAVFYAARDLLTNLGQVLAQEKKAGDILVNIVLLTRSQKRDIGLSEEADDFLKMNGTVLLDKVKTQVANKLMTLPSILSSANESATLFNLQTLQNGIELTTSVENVDAILDAVESGLPLKIRKTAPLSPTSIRDIAPYNPSESGSLYLKDIGLDIGLSEATQASMADLLRTVGSKINISDIPTVVGSLANRLRALEFRGTQSLDSTGILWIISNVIRGFPAGKSDLYDIFTYCLESIDSQTDSVIEDANRSVSAPAHTAMSCYVIGEAALVEGSSFNEYLVDMIYPLFSLIGHGDNQFIRDQAGIAIAKVAYACGFTSPQALAIANKDYLVDGWSMQLNTLNMTPGTFESLASLIFISGDTIIPFLDDVFATLFVLMDHYHGYSKLVKGILTVFGALAVVVRQSNEIKLAIAAPKRSKTLEIGDFQELIEELKRKPEVDPTITDTVVDVKDLESPAAETPDEISEQAESDNENIQDEPDQSAEVWSYPIPQATYMTLKKISDYCDRLMTHESPEIRLATLILITDLMPFLAINKEMFLPLIHRTWPEAISRLFDKEVYVVEQSFSCLGAIAIYAEDFVASRIDKIWPRILVTYSNIFLRKWPQFSKEQRLAKSFSDFFRIVVENVSDISLATLESGIVTFRPAFMRGEFTLLHDVLAKAKPSIADLLWIVLLESPISPKAQDLREFHTVMPVYNEHCT